MCLLARKHDKRDTRSCSGGVSWAIDRVVISRRESCACLCHEDTSPRPCVHRMIHALCHVSAQYDGVKMSCVVLHVLQISARISCWIWQRKQRSRHCQETLHRQQEVTRQPTAVGRTWQSGRTVKTDITNLSKKVPLGQAENTFGQSCPWRYPHETSKLPPFQNEATVLTAIRSRPSGVGKDDLAWRRSELMTWLGNSFLVHCRTSPLKDWWIRSCHQLGT